MPKEYENKMINRAKELRKNMTREECHLWYDFLRNYPVKFTRQEVIYHFIADFYCAKAKLVIEIDGNTHCSDEAQKYDEYRTDYLEHHHGALNVVRFTNNDVNYRFEEVCESIDKIVKELTEK